MQWYKLAKSGLWDPTIEEKVSIARLKVEMILLLYFFVCRKKQLNHETRIQRKYLAYQIFFFFLELWKK